MFLVILANLSMRGFHGRAARTFGKRSNRRRIRIKVFKIHLSNLRLQNSPEKGIFLFHTQRLFLPSPTDGQARIFTTIFFLPPYAAAWFQHTVELHQTWRTLYRLNYSAATNKKGISHHSSVITPKICWLQSRMICVLLSTNLWDP